MKRKIAVAVHTYGHIDPAVYANHVGVFSVWAKKFQTMFLHIDGVKVSEGRNLLVERAMEEACTHILFLDSDHLVDDNLLPCLLGNTIATVVSGLIVRRDGKNSQVGFLQRDDGYFHNIVLPTDGLSYSVAACAFGCTLIDLSIFKSIEKPYFKDSLVRDSKGELRQQRSDMEFCREVKALGKDIRIDTRVRVGHVGRKPIHYPEVTQYQLPAYKAAADVAKEMDKPLAIDFGCGYGAKLAELIEPLCQSVIGIDQNQRISFCPDMNPDSKITWLALDLDKSIKHLGNVDLIICADVLEHLSNPETLIKTIVEHLKDDGVAVISTPDSETTSKDVEINPSHKNFWNEEQFVTVLKANGLNIVELKREEEITEYISMIAICKKAV